MLKTTLFSVVRNEFPQIRSFLAQATALFNKVVIIDHLSDDGTLEELIRWQTLYPQIEIYKCVTPVFRQSRLLSYVANHEVRSGSADWFFFLDGDEFLPFRSREELNEALFRAGDADAISINRRDLIPLSYGYENAFDQEYIAGPVVLDGNVALKTRAVREQYPFCVSHANYEILSHNGGIVLPSESADFDLLHIPIRSLEQITYKVHEGSKSLPPALSRVSHWTRMKEMLELDTDPVPLMNAFIVHFYTEGMRSFDMGKVNLAEYSCEALKNKGYQQLTLDYAHSDLSAVAALGEVSASKPLPELSVDEKGNVTCNPEPSYEPESSSQAALDQSVSTFKTLSDIPLGRSFDSPDAALVSFLGHRSPVTDPLREYHVPFLFSVVSHLQPRRYVEVGPHLSVSAFAAGQTMQYSPLSTGIAAIFSWKRRYHPGQYRDRFHQNFEIVKERNARKLSISAEDLKKTEALFEDGAIDLLQLNDRHGYESIEQAYGAWLPKVSKNGCVIIHDSKGSTTFDVANLFRKVREEVPASYEFYNNGGLGVLAFGDASSNPMIHVIAAMNANKRLMENYYCEFSSDRRPALEAYYVADSLKTIQKYSCPKRIASIVRWMKRAVKIAAFFEYSK